MAAGGEQWDMDPGNEVGGCFFLEGRDDGTGKYRWVLGRSLVSPGEPNFKLGEDGWVASLE